MPVNVLSLRRCRLKADSLTSNLYYLMTLVWSVIWVSVVVYILSMIEVVGSYCLTIRYQSIHWGENITICILLPFLAPCFAINSITRARDQYESGSFNKYHVEESLVMYLLHGCKSLNEWHFKEISGNKKKHFPLMIVETSNRKKVRRKVNGQHTF